MNENQPLSSLLHYIKTGKYPLFPLLLAELRLLNAVLPPTLPLSPRRLLHIAITFSPQALTVIFFHLARILPPLTILVASLAIYTPTTLITLIDITTYPLLITAAAFYLAYFRRRRQPWAPRIFSPIPWAALRLSALAILIANLALSLPIALSTFLISAFALTASLTLMHYTTLILAADILAPRRIRTI